MTASAKSRSGDCLRTSMGGVGRGGWVGRLVGTVWREPMEWMRAASGAAQSWTLESEGESCRAALTLTGCNSIAGSIFSADAGTSASLAGRINVERHTYAPLRHEPAQVLPNGEQRGAPLAREGHLLAL